MRLSRAILMIPLIALVTSCENFTLVGSVNLGGQPIQSANDNPEERVGKDQKDEQQVCWPHTQAQKALAEITAHHFTPKSWPETEKFFAALVPVSRMHPVCATAE